MCSITLTVKRRSEIWIFVQWYRWCIAHGNGFFEWAPNLCIGYWISLIPILKSVVSWGHCKDFNSILTSSVLFPFFDFEKERWICGWLLPKSDHPILWKLLWHFRNCNPIPLTPVRNADKSIWRCNLPAKLLLQRDLPFFSRIVEIQEHMYLVPFFMANPTMKVSLHHLCSYQRRFALTLHGSNMTSLYRGHSWTIEGQDTITKLTALGKIWWHTMRTDPMLNKGFQLVMWS